MQKFVETGRDLGLNRKDLNSLKSSLNGIETTMEQCEGDTLDQMKAAIMLLKFGRDLEAAWKRETTKLKEPPSTKVVGAPELPVPRHLEKTQCNDPTAATKNVVLLNYQFHDLFLPSVHVHFSKINLHYGN